VSAQEHAPPENAADVPCESLTGSHRWRSATGLSKAFFKAPAPPSENWVGNLLEKQYRGHKQRFENLLEKRFLRLFKPGRQNLALQYVL